MEQDASSSIQEMKTSLKMPTLLLEVCLSPGLSPGSVKEVCPRFAKGTCVMGERCIYQHPGDIVPETGYTEFARGVRFAPNV